MQPNDDNDLISSKSDGSEYYNEYGDHQSSNEDMVNEEDERRSNDKENAEDHVQADGIQINENQKIVNNGKENSQKEKDGVRDQIHDDQNI